MNADDARLKNLSPLKRALITLEELQTRLEASESAKTEPIAIIGLSCRFPGGASDPEAYYRLLADGVDAITEVPKDRWDIDAFYDPNPDAPGKMYTRWGGFLSGIDQFDPAFFGISPREAESMDPQQRLLLELAWEALERAGLAPDGLSGSKTGVFLGLMGSDYGTMGGEDPRAIDTHYVTGAAPSIAAGRLSYILGLNGPSLIIDTACSSSLVAIHFACQSLRNGESELALAGGVNLMLRPQSTIASSKLRALAPDGRCKTFDAAANGYVRSEGGGMVVLKRISKALADGDPVLAILRGTAVNQDGRSNGLTAPSATAQEAVVRAALANAAVAPGDVDYVEVHGTGTPLGDPIEVRALSAVFGKGRTPERPLILGSAKTNIGHLEAAAGMAGLIKVVLSMRKQAIPPHLHFKELNPHISLQELPAVIPQVLHPWPVRERARIAGVSSFGFSGTNAHAIVEEAPRAVQSSGEAPSPQVLCLSATSDAALDALAERYRAFFQAPQPDAGGFADVCYTAQIGRSHHERRLALVADGAEDAAAQLGELLAGGEAPRVARGQVKGLVRPKVAFLFTGAGSQYTGMGRELYETEPVFRAALDRCQAACSTLLARPLLSVIHPEPGEASPLDEIAFALPAMFALQFALCELWKSWGITPDYVMGHSAGELAAACVAGAFDVEDGLRLIARRGQLMHEASRDGAMLAINTDEARVVEALRAFAGELSVAAINGPEDVVVSGTRAAVDTLSQRFEAEGIKTKRLAISVGAHSPLMDPMLDAFERVAGAITYARLRTALISNVTGQLAEDDAVSNALYWRRHVREPVRFASGMRTLAGLGVDLFVEIGPHPTLLGMGARGLPAQGGTWLPSLRKGQSEARQMRESLGALYARGADADWGALHRGAPRSRVILPTYTWQRERYWRGDAVVVSRVRSSRDTEIAHPMLGRRLRASPLVREIIFEAELLAADLPYSTDHRVHGRALVPASAYLDAVIAAAQIGSGSVTQGFEIRDIVIREPLILADESPLTLQIVLVPEEAGEGEYAFQIITLENPDGDGGWTLHAQGRVVRADGAIDEAPDALEETRARCTEEVSVDGLYAELEGHGLALGPRFRAIASLQRAASESLGRLVIPASLAPELTESRMHPALLDACLQVVAAAVPSESARDGLHLLVRVERYWTRVWSGGALWSHASVRPGDGGELVADVRIFDAGGACVAQLDGIHLRRLSPNALRPRESGAPSFYEVQWLPSVSPPRPHVEAGGAWLVFADRGGVGRALAERLNARGEHCVVVAPELHAETTADAMAQILRTEGPFRGVVHLGSLDIVPAEHTTAESLRADLQRGTASVFHLVQAIDGAGAPLPRLVVATRGAQPVLDGNSVHVTAAAAPLWGMTRVLAHEHPGLTCTRVDLDPAVSAAPAASSDELDALLSVLDRPDAEDEIAFRGHTRYVPRLVRSAPEPLRAPYALRDDGTYLIVGGLGGIGLTVAGWLVARGARSVVLVGRSGASADAESVLQGLRDQGARVTVLSADVTNAEQLAGVLQTIERDGPPLRGVLHMAGVLSDALLVRLDWERFQKVLAPKVEGAWHLHALTRHLPLDFFVLFSSGAALLGSPGVGNYMAANAFLDALAHQRRALGLPALSVNWGVWAGTGMAQHSRWTDGQGESEEAFSPDQGLAALEQLLSAGTTQAAVMKLEGPRLRALFPSGKPPQLVADLLHFAGGEPNAAQKAPRIRQRLDEAPADERYDILARYVGDLVGGVLGLRASHRLEPDRGFFEMGMDSLMAVDIKNRLEAGLGLPLSTAVIFNYPTAQSLSEHLAGLLELTPTLTASVSPPGSSEPTPEPASPIGDDVTNLSDAQMEEFIAGELAKLLG